MWVVGFGLPKKMFWTEVLFAWLPIDPGKRGVQILVRLLFLFLLWFSGFVVSSVDGLGAEYVSNVQLLVPFFGTGFIILFGTYMIQSTLTDTVLSIRPLLRLDDSSFKKLFGRIELYSFSFVPVLLLALLFTAFLLRQSPHFDAAWERFSERACCLDCGDYVFSESAYGYRYLDGYGDLVDSVFVGSSAFGG